MRRHVQRSSWSRTKTSAEGRFGRRCTRAGGLRAPRDCLLKAAGCRWVHEEGRPVAALSKPGGHERRVHPYPDWRRVANADSSTMRPPLSVTRISRPSTVGFVGPTKPRSSTASNFWRCATYARGEDVRSRRTTASFFARRNSMLTNLRFACCALRRTIRRTTDREVAGV